nr:hypothetical protein [Tanacetum cinerariifolium]
MQTQTSNTLHNAIIEAGGKDRPPMLAPGIYNDIYSTVDACPNACEMWKAIERLKHGESINVQDLETNLYWECGKFTLRDDNETSKDKEIDKLMALISLSFKKIYKPTNNNLRNSLNTSRANQDNPPRINRNAGYENQRIGNVAGARETVARDCQKPKRANDAAYHREKMLLCKQEEARIQLNAEQAIWRDDTDDDELEDQELEAHYMYVAQLQEVSPDATDSGPIFDDEPLQRVSNNDHYNVFAMEKLARRNSKEYASQMELEWAKVRGDLLSYKMESQKSCTKYTDTINDLNQTISEMKDKLSAHQETISILSQQIKAQIKLYKTREDNELDKVIELEQKVNVLDNIVYKTGQSVQTMNMLNKKCRTSFAKPEFLKKAQRANPRL